MTMELDKKAVEAAIRILEDVRGLFESDDFIERIYGIDHDIPTAARVTLVNRRVQAFLWELRPHPTTKKDESCLSLSD